MSGMKDLSKLLASLQPALLPGEYVFVTRDRARYGDGAELSPIASFQESEGLTLVALKQDAVREGERFDAVFRLITLQVHSSLESVGLTAAVTSALAQRGISANVIAAFHHDHLFVPAEQANQALEILSDLV